MRSARSYRLAGASLPKHGAGSPFSTLRDESGVEETLATAHETAMIRQSRRETGKLIACLTSKGLKAPAVICPKDRRAATASQSRRPLSTRRSCHAVPGSMAVRALHRRNTVWQPHNALGAELGVDLRRSAAAPAPTAPAALRDDHAPRANSPGGSRASSRARVAASSSPERPAVMAARSLSCRSWSRIHGSPVLSQAA